MTTELATRGGNTYEVTARDYKNSNWTEKDVQFFREKFAKNSTPEEFKHFLDICSKYDLDPRVGHIYCQKYQDRKNGGWSPAAIIIGYHGMLHVANRDSLLDGIESECHLDEKGGLISATATVWKKGCAHPFKSEVDLSEYMGQSPFWRDKPKTMLKKVAEAHALRKAFNLAGLYLKEEIEVEQFTEQELPAQAPRQTLVDKTTGEIIDAKPAPKLATPANFNELMATSLAIYQQTGVTTYSEKGWLPLTNGQFGQAILGFTTIDGMGVEKIKQKLGINSFAEVVKPIYPDAKGAAQFSAALHYIWHNLPKLTGNQGLGLPDSDPAAVSEAAESEPF